MRFKAKKQYGNYREANCPFCGKIATQKNPQGLEVCRLHTKELMEEIRCSCGSWLESRSGKFGPYFHCLKCGNVPYKKGMELKALQESHRIIPEIKKQELIKKQEFHVQEKENLAPEKEKHSYEKKHPKEMIISTNDVEYFD